MRRRATALRFGVITLSLLGLAIFMSGNEQPTCTPVNPVTAPCLIAADCDGAPLDLCDGSWACVDAACLWECTPPACVPEGGSAAVIPDAPECCPGLVKIPCGGPAADGTCPGCDGASICAHCGDGACGLGENICNCPADCAPSPSMDPACAQAPASCGEARGVASVTVYSGFWDEMPEPLPIPYPGVRIEAIREGVVVAEDVCGDDGDYGLLLSPGTWTLRAIPPGAEDPWDMIYPQQILVSIELAAGAEVWSDFTFHYEGDTVDKPNIYLYPEESQAVSVDLIFGDEAFLVTSDPDYADGWQVTAEPDGLLDGTWGFLFYEAAVGGDLQTTIGHDVPAAELEAWMLTTLPQYGFNAQETQDFVDFWVDALPPAAWYTFCPQGDAAISPLVELAVSPAPQSRLRLWFVVMPGDAPRALAIPVIEPFERDGFTLVEWGVVVRD